MKRRIRQKQTKKNDIHSNYYYSRNLFTRSNTLHKNTYTRTTKEASKWVNSFTNDDKTKGKEKKMKQITHQHTYILRKQ